MALGTYDPYANFFKPTKIKGLPTPKPRKPINRVSKKQKPRLREYAKLRADYLATHRSCEWPDCSKRSRDIHHVRGRVGAALCDTSGFRALCRNHHDECHRDAKAAERIGMIEREYEKH